MAEVSDNFARTASFKLPKVKESFPLIQTKSMSYGNLASALINPTTRLSIAHTQNRDEFSPSARGSPRLPTISEIQGYSDGFLSSKKRCLETSPNPPPVSSQRVIKLPRVKLAQAKRGIHTGPS